MSIVTTFAGAKPVVKLGRIAGQFAKPRSQANEEKDGVVLPSYRGDSINDSAFTEQARSPDPERLLMAYRQAAATLNLLRAFTQGGYANLDMIHKWTLGFAKDQKIEERYTNLVERISEALNFMRSIGVNPENSWPLRFTNLYTSHEAFLLNYEEPFTRIDSLSGDWYATS